MFVPHGGASGKTADTGNGQMGDLHTVDHFGIGRAMLLKAVRARAKVGDDQAATDIATALAEIEALAVKDDWWGLVERACWLAMRAEGGET